MNILLTSAGRRTYLVNYFKEALSGKGLVYASNSILTYTLQQADGYVLTPQIYDNDYIDFLLEFCKNKNINVIISLFDIDLPVLAKNKNIFEKNGIRVVVSSENVTNICNDKWETYKFLKGIGINQAKTYISLDNVLSDLNSAYISFPLILKPRWGMGSIGIYQAENIEELHILYEKIKRTIFNSYLKYESQIDESSCILIQEKIIGQEFGLEILNNLESEYVTTIAKKKIAMRAGETDIAEIVDNSIFENISKKISQNLKHIANLDVDCFVTSDNEIFVLEMNCRFGGQYPFSHLAGVNFPKQIIKWLSGEKTEDYLVTPMIGTVACKELVPVILKKEFDEK